MDNANITLNIKQTSNGITDSSELFTKGEFREHGGSYFIDYDDSEATGYEGSHVQLRVGDGVVVMTRTGSTFTSLVFEDGKRHLCHYGTEYGDCMIGVSTTELRQNLTNSGGRFSLRYTIDVNASLMTENEIIVNVRSKSDD